MGRAARVAPGGTVFHALNRGVGRKQIFENDADYRAFETVLMEAVALMGTRLCAYCVMPNHWHLVLWPSLDGELSQFMHRLTLTHTARWKAHRDLLGDGHLYQGRFKSFPVQSDEHYLTVVRYVERNALRANLVRRAELWPFSSLSRRSLGVGDGAFLSAGPLELPNAWVDRVNRPETSAELLAVRGSVRRGNPYGAAAWQKKVARDLDLESTLRPRGRPRKSPS